MITPEAPEAGDSITDVATELIDRLMDENGLCCGTRAANIGALILTATKTKDAIVTEVAVVVGDFVAILAERRWLIRAFERQKAHEI